MEKLFISVLNLSLISSYVILFVLAIRLLLRKAPKVFSYALWTIVFFKLICPATFESMISLIPEQVSTRMIVNTDIIDTTTHEKTEQIESPVEPNNIEMNSNLKTTDEIKSKPTYYLSMIWVSGILIGFVYSLISIIILKKRLSSAVNVRDNLYESAEINTPFVMGMLRPKIYLPVELSKEEQTYIIRHEQVHIQRRDYLIKIAAFSISCIHWFNPLVWLSFLLMNRDMEMSCDEKVMKELGSDIKKVYSSSLLSLAAGRKMPNGIPLAFGERDVKSRIKNVLNYKKPTLWIIIVSTLVVVVAGIGLLFNPSSNNNYKDKEQPVELEDFIIADDEITLYDETIANIQLIMTKGTYYEEEYVGAGGGTYPENYMGDYELRLISQAGKVLSTLSLNKDWDYAQINFSGEFDILFTEYNSDSCPDFTIGTYGSSNIGLYYLYSITEENQIKRICETSISENSKEPSVVFEHEPQDGLYQFLTYVYNNVAGQNEHHIYNWDADSGNFILSEVTQFNENGEVENTNKSTGEFKWYGKTSLISEKMVLPETLIKSPDDMNDFLESDSTIALLATIPNEDIYLYGLKENGSGNEDDFLYRLHGICIQKEDEIQVLDIDWGIYGDIPQIQYEDYDNDGQKELALILRSAQGTDLSLLDLHVFEKAEVGGLVDNFFTDWADQLNELVTYEVKDGILKLYVKGEQLEEIDIAAQEETWGEKFQAIVFGDNVEFLFDNGKIYLQVQPNAIAGNWVTPQEITDTYIRMEVQYNGGFVIDSESITLTPEKELVENIDDDLCGENEEILLNFQMVDLDKYMSVCMSKNQPEYIIYRFGTKEDIELEYSDKTVSSWDKFTYSYYLRGGGTENEGVDLNYLYFEKEGYKYQIYEEYSSNNEDASVGILVTNLETGEETDLKGVSESIKGSLIGLRGNEKINLYIQ